VAVELAAREPEERAQTTGVPEEAPEVAEDVVPVERLPKSGQALVFSEMTLRSFACTSGRKTTAALAK
jgi:hypothetical protein